MLKARWGWWHQHVSSAWTQHHVKRFEGIVMLNSLNPLSPSPFHRWRDWGLEKLRDFLKGISWGIRIQISLTPGLVLLTPSPCTLRVKPCVNGTSKCITVRTQGKGGGGMEREFGMSRCKPVYREWINNKVLLYGTGNSLQYPGINHTGKEYEKEYIYV